MHAVSLFLAALAGAAGDAPPPASPPGPTVVGPGGAPALPPPPLVRAPDSALRPAAPGERVVPNQEFIKGELSMFLGADRLVTKNQRIGVSFGYNRIGLVHYVLAQPQIDLKFGDLALGLGVPLNIEVFNANYDTSGTTIKFAHAGRVRQEDWDDRSDFARVLGYLTYGRKEDPLYVNVGQRYAASVGHGALMRRYAPNVDADVARVSAQVDAYNDTAGFEAVTNDILSWNVLAVLGFVKPLSLLGTSEDLGKSFSLGVSVAADLDAPVQLIKNSQGSSTLEPPCDVANATPPPSSCRIAAVRAPVVLAGIDVELKVFKTAKADIKPYVDYSTFLGGEGGLTLGALGRFNTGGDPVHAFRVVVELRILGSRYRPGYFDTFYEMEKYIPLSDPTRPETKFEVVTSGRLPQRLGYYLEASWGVRRRFGVTLSLEGSSAEEEKNFVAHLEVPAVDFFQFFASFYKLGFKGLDEFAQIHCVGQADPGCATGTIVFAGARLRLLPFLFFNGRAWKAFQLRRETRTFGDSAGYALDVELGWEF